VQASLASLQTTYDGQLTITLSGQSPTVTVSAATYTADQPTLDAITNAGSVVVTGTASAIAAIEPALAADPRVGQVQITDSAVNVINNLPAITALGGAATVTLNDPFSISAADALALINANLAHLNAGSLVVADTGSQLAELAESGTAGTDFLLAQGAALTGNSSVALLDAAALAGLGDALNRNGHVLNVWDTAAHLTQTGAAATLASLTGSGLVTGIYLKTTNNAVTLTAASAASLFAIPGLNVDNPDGSVNVVTVSDTAAHLDSNYAGLLADRAYCGQCQRHSQRGHACGFAKPSGHDRQRRGADFVGQCRQYPGRRRGLQPDDSGQRLEFERERQRLAAQCYRPRRSGQFQHRRLHADGGAGCQYAGHGGAGQQPRRTWRGAGGDRP
jgi:hypothetical protein